MCEKTKIEKIDRENALLCLSCFRGLTDWDPATLGVLLGLIGTVHDVLKNNST